MTATSIPVTQGTPGPCNSPVSTSAPFARPDCSCKRSGPKLASRRQNTRHTLAVRLHAKVAFGVQADASVAVSPVTRADHQQVGYARMISVDNLGFGEAQAEADFLTSGLAMKTVHHGLGEVN